MDGFFAGIASALWLGILTSISPCPLATNIAAISFLSKKIIHPKAVLLSGLFYTLGRTLSYAVLGFVIISSLFSVPALANFLQKYMNKAFGPILIVTGLFLLDVFKFHMPSFSLSQKHQTKLAQSGFGGSFVLGLIFALVFCPVSAGIFFGGLIPLALNNKAGITLPFVYGVGTGLPIVIFAVGVALGVNSMAQWFNKALKLEIYMRKITGVIFVLVGAYYILFYILGAYFK